MAFATIQRHREYHREYMRKWREANRDRERERWRGYYHQHRANYRAKQNADRARNREKWRKYNREWMRLRRSTNPAFKLRVQLASRLVHALQRNEKSGKTIELLGCSIPEFIVYLEAKFCVGMNWQNYGRGWHIDHIMPCASFDLSKSSEQRQCFHFSNLQPMWARANQSKRCRILSNA